MKAAVLYEVNKPLVIEDVDRAGYDEAGLFHLLNQSMRDGRPLLMTAREGIANWPYSTDDVRSRARRAASRLSPSPRSTCEPRNHSSWPSPSNSGMIVTPLRNAVPSLR